MRFWRGSWPVLLLLSATFVALFYAVRGRSVFLQIERDRAGAEVLTRQTGVPLADVLALRDLIGLHAAPSEWQGVVTRFAAGLADASQLVADQVTQSPAPRVPLGNSVGPVVVEPEAAAVAIRGIAKTPLAARRFLVLRERFAARQQ